MSNESAAPKKRSVWKILVAIVVVFIGVSMLTTSPETVVQDALNQVIADAEKEYDMVKRNGSAVDLCLRAGLVAESYLQAKQEDGYKTWKNVERADCAAAGIPK